MMSIAKISVEKHDSKEQFLYDLDKNKTLCDIVRDICKKSGLPESPVYGLKLIQTKDNPFINNYISHKTYKDIQHSDCLKIVFSVEYLLTKRILPHINDADKTLERDISFEDLHKLSVDPVFIEELAKSEAQTTLLDVFINNALKDNEQLALLITICHLFQKGCITSTTQNILDKILNIIKNPNSENEHTKYALSILHKILIQKDHVFLSWKQQIIKELPLTEITPYIWRENSRNLQYGILLLINTIIKLCTGEQKLHLIKEMNLRQNRDNVYRHIILPGELERNTEHELYVLQTYILSLYKEALHSEVSLNDNNLFKREEFELYEDDIRRLTVLMDFDENEYYSNKSISTENLLSYNRPDERLSLASILSDQSQKSFSVNGSRKTSQIIECDNTTINYLTLEALRHYKKHHYKVFYQSQIEEKVYEPGIFVTSERITKMLAKLLHVGMDPPDHRSVLYQPIVFNCSSRLPFFLELFSRTMWLLSRTRREMKVSTIEDYPKVIKVLEKQVKMVLQTRPIDFKCLTDEMTNINADVVIKQWQKEKGDELKSLLKNNPCVQELKTIYSKENEEYIYKNRLNILKQGAHFPKVLEKKTNGSIFVQLGKNERELHIYDITDVKSNKMVLQQKIAVDNITHIVIGKNCKHCNLCKYPSLAFSIVVNHAENQVNFIAKDERMACYWTDGFNLLTKNKNFTEINRRSDYYRSELNDLVEMDIMLKILELQNVTIPKNPPPVPPPPLEIKPPVPPKSEALRKYITTTRKLQ